MTKDSVQLPGWKIAKSDEEQQIVFGWANQPFGPVVKAYSPEGSLDRVIEDVNTAYRQQFPLPDDCDGWQYIIVTFEDSVIASRYDGEETTYLKHSMVRDGDSIVFGKGVEVEQVWVAKQVGGSDLLARMDKSHGDDRAREDQQGDIVPVNELEAAAYEFVLESRQAGAEHTRISGELVESMMLTGEKWEALLLNDKGEPIVEGLTKGVIDSMPQGWWVGFKVDDDAWAQYKSGDYAMFSIGGDATKEPVESS